MKYKQMHADALRAAREIAQRAKAAGRNLTSAETAEFDAQMAKAREAKAQLDAIAASEDVYRRLAEIDGDEGTSAGAKSGRRVLSYKGLAGRLKSRMADRGEPFEVKALIAAGSQVTLAQEIESPVSMGKPATGLLDLLGVKILESGAEFSYLRQTTRTNAAAPVAVGGTKPTSTYTLTRETGHLEVIAHMSQPVPEYWLRDEPSLEQFVGAELGYGIQLAIENEALNGNGTSPHFDGLLHVSGHQVQAFNESQIRTVRSAITLVETVGYTASGLALNPLDWELIETAVDANERFLLSPEGSPINRAARTLWNVPVALTNAIAQGKGLLLSEDPTGPAAKIVTDGKVDFRWGYVSGGFEKNEVVARAETRANVEIYRPLGVVEIELADEG